MKLGKAHLVVSLAMVVGSIAYNIWVFTRPARRSGPVPTPASLVQNVSAQGPVVTGEEAAAAIDPTTVPPPPEVDLARAPEWRRNPFASAWQRRVEVAVAAPTVEVEPDVVVASILHSNERRLAVVNGRIVRAGDRVGSSTILEIQPRAIVVESRTGARRVVEMRAPQTRREAR